MTVPSATRPASGDRTGPATHTGLAHAAFYASVGFMVLAAVLAAIRAKGTIRPAAAGPD